jgi:hypothetical protein
MLREVSRALSAIAPFAERAINRHRAPYFETVQRQVANRSKPSFQHLLSDQ